MVLALPYDRHLHNVGNGDTALIVKNGSGSVTTSTLPPPAYMPPSDTTHCCNDGFPQFVEFR